MTRTALAVAWTLAVAGCGTHQILERNTVRATSTVIDIEYRTVLMNLAKLSRQPAALPDHADLADGVVQINDRLGFGQSGGFTSFASGTYGFGIDRLGPSGERQVTEQWGVDATTDPQRLASLQDLYRVALGLRPLPPPNAIAYLRKRTTDASSSGDGSSQADDQHRQVPIEVLLTDVPSPGWFHVGRKRKVPDGACYVGCYGDSCAWVLADGIQSLSRFTVTVLSVVKLEPGELGRSHGLAVTTP